MNALTSLRDIALVARFELLRNLKTWRALAMILIYLLATGGSAYIFTRFLHSLESSLARNLGLPETEVPGAMVGKLLEDDSLRGAIAKMIGEEALLDQVLQWPLLAIFHLWVATLLVPFLAASTASESIVLDTASRAARFECLRTGRIEFVTGRYVGQVLLLMMATLFSVLSTFTIGMVYMVGNDPTILMSDLLAVTPRIWAISLPFLGVGLLASQLASGVNIARVMALAAVAFSFFLNALATVRLATGGGAVWDVLLQLLPQTYFDGFWAPGFAWLPTAGFMLVLGLAAMGVGLPVFLRKDL